MCVVCIVQYVCGVYCTVGVWCVLYVCVWCVLYVCGSYCAVGVCVCLTCVTGRASVAGLAVTCRLTALCHSTLPLATMVPPTGRRLLSPVTVLACVALGTLAAVGLALRHTQAVDTPGEGNRVEELLDEISQCV